MQTANNSGKNPAKCDETIAPSQIALLPDVIMAKRIRAANDALIGTMDALLRHLGNS